MNLPELLRRERKTILDRWVRHVAETYPRETARFLSRETDRFRNPVGYSIRSGLSSLYDGLLEGRSENERALDDIVRIRAVQEFTPSQAVGFIFLLKRAVRDELDQAPAEDGLGEGLREFESRIDRLALSAFDLYVRCRIQLYEIRARDFKRRNFQLARLSARPVSGMEESDREAAGVETDRKGDQA